MNTDQTRRMPRMLGVVAALAATCDVAVAQRVDIAPRHGGSVVPPGGACAKQARPAHGDPFTARGLHWCATGAENDARIAAAEAEAAARRAAAGATLPSGPANIDEWYGLVVFEDVAGDVLVDNRPFDLGQQTLRFEPADGGGFWATRGPLQFEPDLGELIATWEGQWGQVQADLPFAFPFGDVQLGTVYLTSDIGLFRLPQSPNTSSGQYDELFAVGSGRICPLLRDGLWIWTPIVELYRRTEPGAVTFTWQPRTDRPDSHQGVDQRFQLRIESDGTFTISYPDSSSRNTYGVVQIAAPNDSSFPQAVDLSALDETPTLIEGPFGEVFTFPELLPQSARDALRNAYGPLLDNVDVFAFYQTFYTDIVFYAGGYHSGNVVHMNETNLSWNSRDETSVSVLHHEFGHEWLYFGLPSGTGGHPRQGAHMPAAFTWQTPYDSSCMGGSFWLDAFGVNAFTTLPYRTYYGYSWHELYLMGLATFEEAVDWWYISGVSALNGPYYPPQSSTYFGERVDLTHDVLDNVFPEYPDAQTQFEVLFTLITRPAEPLRDEDLANMRRKMAVWPDAWAAATGNRSSVRVHFDELNRTGDMDSDEDIDLLDFARFQHCFGDNGIAVGYGECTEADLDDDGDVDGLDFSLWRAADTGPCVEPTFRTSPEHLFGCAQHSVSLSVEATGADSLQWRRSGQPIPGATDDTLVIAAPVAADAGTYTVAAANACGTVISPSANLVISDGPHVVLYPHQITACLGDAVTMTVDAAGAGALTYQWHMEQNAIPGATDGTYAIEAVTPSDAGAYTVTVTDDCGTTASNFAFVIIDESCP